MVRLVAGCSRRRATGARSGARDVATPAVWEPRSNTDVRQELAATLRAQVAAMNLENFVVRPRRRTVERYREGTAWVDLSTANTIS
jgi:hypothetical protein